VKRRKRDKNSDYKYGQQFEAIIKKINFSKEKTMNGLGLELLIAVISAILILFFVKKKTVDTGVRIIIVITSLLFLTYAILQIVMYYDGNDFKPASNTSIEGFICEDKNQTLSVEQQERIKEIEKALDDSVGLTFGGHDIPSFYVHPRWEHLYRLQKKFSIEDWELSADIYITYIYNVYNSKIFYKRKERALYSLFMIGGEQAISILECRVNAANLSSYPKKNMQSIISDLRREFGGYGTQQEIKRIREKEEKR
jgi:hypothetical protein